MSLQLKGIVSKVLPIESGEGKDGKSWKRQTFVLAYKDGEYEKSIAVSAFGDKVSQVPGTGQECTVSFNVESREYNGKYYTNVNAWKIEVSGEAKAKNESKYEVRNSSDDENSLPF